ncbi:MAG: DUF1924 domain-containing protein [Alphaproteobacteria bacterium]|nr:MAG: DUF1924 domain-containing protein [Alphaproteobacteria bacterium]
MTTLSTRVAIAAAIAALAAAAVAVTPGLAGGPRDAIIASYAAKAGKPLSAERGRQFFMGTHQGGKPDINSCTVCHTRNLKGPGRTRAGKPIDPMAVSANPNRFTDPKKVEKWFRRNCKTVLGRECTPLEKGDVLTFLSSI